MAADEAPDARETILNSVTDGVFTVDPEWRVTFFNRAAERITGVPCDRAIGRQCAEVFRTSICESACALRETLATGQPVVNKVVYIVTASGSRIPISVSTAVLRDRDGRMVGGVETFRDLTQVEALRKALHARYTVGDIVGRSAPMRAVVELLPVVAAHDTTVLIEGASGTGKELVARALHELSPRRRKRFVAINCGALPETLLESELFGYRAGAFTDARRDKAGRFALAQGGTLFLDEIGDVPLAMQAKLLRVLQEREYEPLGGVESVKATARIVAATNRDLSALVAEGRFRQDLLYRIAVFRIPLPRLCERREDIPILIEHLVARISRLRGKALEGVSDEVLRILMALDYPGNVRELENIIEHAAVLCRGAIIEAGDLPSHLHPHDGGDIVPSEPGVPADAAAGSGHLRDLETALIENALRRHDGNRAAAARALGIDPSTVFRRIRAAGLNVPPRRRSRP
jgi:PAS domain S-box-containing protein